MSRIRHVAFMLDTVAKQYYSVTLNDTVGIIMCCCVAFLSYRIPAQRQRNDTVVKNYRIDLKYYGIDTDIFFRQGRSKTGRYGSIADACVIDKISEILCTRDSRSVVVCIRASFE